jgi:16S rRNA C967 or C1407 C5-methylase (RsmB/RsmF family)
MMTHQLKRLNTAGMMVVSHDAQFFPTIWKDDEEKVQFTKILCDVPCSSDAVLRKLPNKWKNWSPKEAYYLHRLQLQIAKRAFSVLKVGGTLIYSTCSLNPIEVKSNIT